MITSDQIRPAKIARGIESGINGALAALCRICITPLPASCQPQSKPSSELLPSDLQRREYDDRNSNAAETDGRPGQVQPGAWGCIEELAIWAEQNGGDDAASAKRAEQGLHDY